MTNKQKEIDKFYTCNSDRIKETEINKINPEAVDELAKQICRDCDSDWCRNRTTYCKRAERQAMRLYNAGYRKMDEVTLKLDLGDRSAEEILQIAEAFANEPTTAILVPSNESEIRKQVAKEILQAIADNNKAMNVEDCFIVELAEEYGVEIEV